jgi:hypothetical protein
VPLTSQEFTVLECLVRHRGRLVTRATLEETLHPGEPPAAGLGRRHEDRRAPEGAAGLYEDPGQPSSFHLAAVGHKARGFPEREVCQVFRANPADAPQIGCADAAGERLESEAINHVAYQMKGGAERGHDRG